MSDFLPEGFVRVVWVGIHREELSKHTRDIDRFLEYLPAAESLLEIPPGTPEAAAVWDAAEDRKMLHATMFEIVEFFNAVRATFEDPDVDKSVKPFLRVVH